MCILVCRKEGRRGGGDSLVVEFWSKSLFEGVQVYYRKNCLVQLKVKGVWVSLIQVYVPTEDRNQDVKDEIYAKWQDTVGGVSQRDLLIVMGDLNARVGNETDIWGRSLGGTVNSYAMRTGAGCYSLVTNTTN